MTAAAYVLLWLAACVLALGVAFRRSVEAAWREPVLRAPVMILESDDWGYGPVDQSEVLDRLADALADFRDAQGRHPVMTLGVILAGPDTAAMRSDEFGAYHRMALGDPPLAPVRDAMLRGARRGVFALQLHGREHFWPECLMRAAERRPELRDWLRAPGMPRTEELPSHLQSRWIDASALPSRPLPAGVVVVEGAAEVRAFRDVFGMVPEVAVPPTFVWTRDVEAAWAEAGVRAIVTPGRRSESRDAQGKLVYEPGTIHNGDFGECGSVLIVRDVYFEPSLGHEHGRAAEDVVTRSRLGRPALVEVHRMNFVPDESGAGRAIDDLGKLIGLVLSRLPRVRFMTVAELATHYREATDLLERRRARRLHYMLRRLAGVSRLRKMAWITGAIVPAWVAWALTRPRQDQGTR